MATSKPTTKQKKMIKNIEAINKQLEALIEQASAAKETDEGVPAEVKEGFKNIDITIRGARTVFGVSGYQRKEKVPSPEGYVSMEEFAELLGVKLVTLRARWPLYRVAEHKFEGQRGLFFNAEEAKQAAQLAHEKRAAKEAAKVAKLEAAEAAKAAKEAISAE